MAIEVYVETIQVTATGTIDVTDTGFGTPAAVAVFAVRDSTELASASSWQIQAAVSSEVGSIGFSDGTTDKCLSFQNEESGTADCDCDIKDFIACLLSDAGGNQTRLGHNSWITDGVRFDATHLGQDLRAVVVLFGGTGTSAAAGVQNTAAVTGIGFTPDLLIHAASGNSVTSGTSIYASFGVACRASGNEASMAWYRTHNTGTAVQTASIRDDFVVHSTSSSTTSPRGTNNVSSWDASGWTESSPTGPDNYFRPYLALKFDGEVDVLNHAHSASADKSFTGYGFQPEFLLFGTAIDETINTIVASGADADSGMNIGVYDGTTQCVVATSSTDAAAAITAFTGWTDDLVSYSATGRSSGTVHAAHSIASLDSDGFSLTYEAGASASQFWALAIGAATSAASRRPVQKNKIFDHLLRR